MASDNILVEENVINSNQFQNLIFYFDQNSLNSLYPQIIHA